MRIKRFLFGVVLLAIALITIGCKTNFVKFANNKELEIKVGEKLNVKFETNLTVEDFYAKTENTKIATVNVKSFANKTLEITAIGEGETNLVIGQKGKDKVVAKLKVKVTKPADVTAPHINGLVDGKIPGIEHLKGDVVDFTQLPANVTAVDNVDGNVPIVIDSMGTYDKDVAGTYIITYKAEDAAGNKKVVEREVIVKETLEVTLPHALVYEEEGKKEYTKVEHNNPDAFTKTPNGANFRFNDIIQVMDKQFYLDEVEKNKPNYGGKEPMFVYGVAMIFDRDSNFVKARMGNGVAFEIDKDGKKYYPTTQTEDPTIINKELVWSHDGSKGGMLIGLGDEIPDGGYVVLATPKDPQNARKFATRYISHKTYNGGASNASDVVNTFPRPILEVKHDYVVKIEMPPALAKPVLKYSAHKLTWDAVENAKGYALYKNDTVEVAEINALEFDLSKLDLEVTPEGQPGYKFQLKALTQNIFEYVDSELSNEIMYVKKDLKPLDTPLLTVDEENKKVTWNAVENATEYIVKLYVGNNVVLEKTLTKDTLEFNYGAEPDLLGKYRIVVIAVANPEDALNSVEQENNFINVLGTPKMMNSGDMTNVKVYEITAKNYFMRRNETGEYKLFEDGLYLISGVNEYKKEKNFVEAFSTIVLLDSENKVKMVRNIMPKQEFLLTNTTANKWELNEKYASNGKQLVELDELIAEGDKLLIGKNGHNKVTVTYNGTELTNKKARDVLAHIFVKVNDDFAANSEAWRHQMSTFLDSSTVVFQLV